MIIAATGHRPDKLGGYGQNVHNKLVKLATKYLILKKPTKIISGMAIGWDQAFAIAGVNLKIPVLAAIPFAGQESKWPDRVKDNYAELLSNCSEIKIVCEGGYAAWKMQKRNEWMVDNCDRLVALWNGSPGGTGNCIKYANSKVLIDNLWDEFK